MKTKGFNKTISIYGLGYIGLPTAAMFASKGIQVIGIDVNKDIIDSVNNASVLSTEPGLNKKINELISKKLIKAFDHAQESEVFIITVPTPIHKDDKNIEAPQADISYILNAAGEISKVLKKGDLIILESTSPVGTTKKLSNFLEQKRKDLTFPHKQDSDSDVRIAYCPERVMPGNIIYELENNDRIIGGLSKRCSREAKKVYEIFLNAECFLTDADTAEMAKLTENASRDVQIAFANELSIICDKNGINVWELIKLVNKHPRVNVLQPGPGVGGHCIAVDPWFIVAENPVDSKLIKKARQINDSKPGWVIKKIKDDINKILEASSSRELKIGFFGITFKPNIDDIRESPSLEIVEYFSKENLHKIYVIEPNIKSLPDSIKNAELVDENFKYENCDILVILVDHDQFKSINFKNMHVIDTKGILNDNDGN